MFNKYKNKLFLILILLSIGVSFYYVIGRHEAESVYKNYDIAADYDDFAKVGYNDNKTAGEYLKELSKNGVSSISLNETTINSLKKDPNVNIKTELEGLDLVVEGDREYLDLISEGLSVLKDKRNIEKISDEKIVIEGRPSDMVSYKSDTYDILQERVGDDGNVGSVLEYVGLGYDKNKVDTVKSIDGLELNLRPTFYSRYQDSRLTMERFISALETLNPNQKYIIFSGKEAYKNTDTDQKVQDDFVNWINSRNISLGMIEASNQRGHLKIDGIDPMVKKDGVGKIRAFTTWDYLQSEYDYSIPGHQNGEELTNVYYRAISERNISVVYLKPFIKNDKIITEAEKYGSVIENLNMRLESKGYEEGNVNSIGQWNPNAKLKVIISMGVVCASIMLLGLLFPIGSKFNLFLFISGILISIVFFGLGIKESLGNILFNLLAIVVYPSLALCVVVENYNQLRRKKSTSSLPKIYMHGVLILFVAILITMIGSLMEISYMSGTNYLVELSEFRGVKISQLLPLVISLLIFLAYIGFGRKRVESPRIRINEITGILNLNVKVWQAVLGVCVVGMLAIFIIRGGNSNTKVPGIELLFRNLLEEYLPARPRTKALFIGFPSVFLLMYMGYYRRGEIFAMVITVFVAIGQADIVNTFSHIRTPLTMSFVRIGIEFVMACILSAVMLLVVDLFRKCYDKYIAKEE